MKKKATRSAILIGCCVAAILFSGCGANDSVLRSGKETPAPPVVETQADLFARDLADVKGANFFWIYVIRRRDGGILNAEDKALIRSGTAEANRRVVSDGGQAVIVGSNYEASVAAIETLKPRFDVTDLSTGKPPATEQPAR